MGKLMVELGELKDTPVSTDVLTNAKEITS